MGNEDNPDQEIIARLRDKAEQLERLESRLSRLEQEYQQLADSKELLSGQLAHYHRSLTEWEWFFEHSVQMLCIAGLDGYFKRVNSAFADALGYTKEELMSRPFIEFVHADDVSDTLKELKGWETGGTASTLKPLPCQRRKLALDCLALPCHQ